MTHTSADLLEFPAVKSLVARFVASPAGRALLEQVAPTAHREALQATHAGTAEAIAYHAAAAQPQTAARGAAIRLHFEGLPDPAPILAKLAITGVVLEGLELRDLIALLDRACDARAVLTATASRYPLLAAQAARIPELRPLLAQMSGNLEPDGRVSDHASVALQRIRRDLERQQKLIQAALDRFIREHRDDGILQEEFVAIRNERFVLPVAAGQKRRVDGIIHAASGSGHTLFIEPLEAVDLNNDLVRLREQELREVHRILSEMTGLFRAASAEVAEAVQVIAGLELVFAKARFAAEFDCVVPRFGNRLAVTNARHPLLADVLRRQRRPVVPLSLVMEGSTHTLLISGPNTGGKTVALKTIGLLVLMAQSGLPVPAESAELPLFEQVLADIGDNQSIEQSLSTFSAHMARIREILEIVGPDSLVLFDELGSATDPAEGGALGVAILDHTRRAGAFTLASTHLLAPKVYGSTTEGVLNAAMSFDEETLAPTYHLRVGAPGASVGLDIAQRLGLPASLIEQARGLLSGEQRQIARFLKLIEERLESATRIERQLAAGKAALDQERASQAAAAEIRESKKLRELERRAEEMLTKFEARAGEALHQIAASAEPRKTVAKAEQKVARTKREIREELEVMLRPGAVEAAPVEIAQGARVRLRGVREPARVRRLLAGGNLEVEAGFLRLQVSREDVLEVLPDTPEGAKLPVGISVRTVDRVETGGMREINLIGRRAAEAVAEVDKFLDKAALASVSRLRIVHGHGMGILKKAVAELLASHPHVAKFYAAPPSEGGAGATIVELRSD